MGRREEGVGGREEGMGERRERGGKGKKEGKEEGKREGREERGKNVSKGRHYHMQHYRYSHKHITSTSAQSTVRTPHLLNVKVLRLSLCLSQ